jgi:hypothetical protein
MSASGSIGRRALVTLCVLAGWLGLAAPAWAQASRKTVVMVVDSQLGPLSRRLAQEVEALGLTVKVVAAGVPAEPSLAQEALAAKAVAAIYVAPTADNDVEVTILDGATGKAVSWKFGGPASLDPATAELIPTRAVELLRASLLKLAARRAPPVAPSAAPVSEAATKPPTPAATDSTGSLAVMLGPALLHSMHLRPGAELQSSVTWMPLRRLGLKASVLAPLVASRLTSSQGSVELWATLFRLGGVVEIGRQAAPVSLRCEAGIEHERLRLQGRPNPPYRAATDSATTFSPFVGIAPRFRVTGGVYIVTDFVLALASPTTVIRLAGREVTDWGRPLGTVAVGLELEWPATQGATGLRKAALELAPR